MAAPAPALPPLHLWECEDGHVTAVSSVAMTEAIVEPRCDYLTGISLGHGSATPKAIRCQALLRRRLR